MFEPVRGQPDFPAIEAVTAAFWRDRTIYEKTLLQRQGAKRFVFFEGPPTANGMPHPGHCLTRTIKDLYPRYRTMRGQLCQRKAGWDTHGLPVEVEVCKELGIHSKAEIEAYGIEAFIHRCQESVWRYMKEWETLTERIGFWIDLSDAYVTYQQSYVESVWWALCELFNRGLLYQGHKIVWWWAQGGTALSAGEVGQGYREVADPSVYVSLPLCDQSGNPTHRSLVAWTTTPWTLPANQFVAVRPDLAYAVLRETITTGESTREPLAEYIVVEALAASFAEKLKKQFDTLERIPGAALVGSHYLPPFPTYRRPGPAASATRLDGTTGPLAWRVVAGDFVTTDTGTGIVHIAPAFGEVDYSVLMAEQAGYASGCGPELLNCVAADGTFTDDFPLGSGRFVKDCDRDITRDLKSRGLLVHQEQYLHDYPFCWRAEKDPLIQYPRSSWFIRTSNFREEMLANNAQINWLPEHIKDGRFGNFLASNVDWALSRERYWGTPLPIWICSQTGQAEAVPSYATLLAKPGVTGSEVFAEAKAANPALADDLKVHKPYIDAVTYDSPFAQGARMNRVTEVIDCWFDSGAMPFAQWGWPHRGQQEFSDQFPADFISEAIDQTRGWFYSQLAISTLLFGDKRPYPHPFGTCIVLGHMLGEDGTKMSKSKRNYREPAEIFDTYGADALRWFFLAGQPPWTSIRYSERAIRESVPEFLLRLWNVYSFFVIYARIDGFDPAAGFTSDGSAPFATPGSLNHTSLCQAHGYTPIADRSELDRWLISELNATAANMVERMDRYDHFAAAGLLSSLVDAVSNWYVRRSRDRFWAAGKADSGPSGNATKLDAYWTLYETLLSITQLAAPFVPFISEALWRNLAVTPFGKSVPESVHLCDYPTGDASLIDGDLVRRMAMVRDISSLGRAARAAERLKVRQPLSKVEVIFSETAFSPATRADDILWLKAHADLVCDELNVKQFEICREPDRYITRSVQADLKKLGPRLGKNLPKARDTIATTDPAVLLAAMARDGRAVIVLPDGVELVLEPDDVIVRTAAREGWAAAEGPRAVVVVASQLTPELVAEGLVREVVHAVQSQRRGLDLEFTDRISLMFETASRELRAALETHLTYVCSETLAASAEFGMLCEPVGPQENVSLEIDGHPLLIGIRPLCPMKAPAGREA